MRPVALLSISVPLGTLHSSALQGTKFISFRLSDLNHRYFRVLQGRRLFTRTHTPQTMIFSCFAALSSIGVRPVRLVPVPCRITNLRRKTPSDPNHRILVAGKATDEGVLGVRRLTLTRPAAKKTAVGACIPLSTEGILP